MAEIPAAPIRFGRIEPLICERDVQIAYDFYAGVLGFSKVFENGRPAAFIVLKKGDAEFHLGQKRDHLPSALNLAHMFVSDAAALYAACEANGVRIVKRLMDKDCGQRAFVFADPDFNRIDVGERIDPPAAA